MNKMTPEYLQKEIEDKEMRRRHYRSAREELQAKKDLLLGQLRRSWRNLFVTSYEKLGIIRSYNNYRKILLSIEGQWKEEGVLEREVQTPLTTDSTAQQEYPELPKSVKDARRVLGI